MLALALGFGSPAAARDRLSRPALEQQVESVLAQAGPGTRFGLLVTTTDGEELLAIAADSRFIPASNVKVFTTAAAFDSLEGLDAPDQAGGTIVRLQPNRQAPPDVILEGRGDARMTSAPDCVTNCLAALADAVAARTKVVHNVVGDASFFPDERWSLGMSWNNIPTRSGTGISALSLDDNELALRVSPGAVGQPPKLEIASYYRVDNRALTVSEGKTDLSFERLPGTTVVRLAGTIAQGSEPKLLRLGIDDPAHYAAWRFRAFLESRGVRVIGAVTAKHRPMLPLDGRPAGEIVPEPLPSESGALAALTPPPLSQDLRHINKVSQNVHAELMLRRLGRYKGTGSVADGVAAIRTMLERAGVPGNTYELADGSGMSTYNRVTPRGMVTLLRWIGTKPWGTQWRATLPTGGIDGTLASRFRGTALQGRVFAKTGTLHATYALSGYLIANSGRTLLFSAFANDVPEDVSATKALDSALELIAREN